MTDRPTNRINRPPAGRADSEDARTQRAYRQNAPAAMPTSQIRDDGSSMPTQASPLAWSQDAGEVSHNPEYYQVPGGYQPYPPQDVPDSASAHDSNTDAPSHRFWLRSAPTYLLAGAAVAVLAAGGGLAYTLTGSNHQNPAPAHQSVAPPVPQQNNVVAPAPEVSPAMPVQSAAPAPDAPMPATDDGSGPAPNVVPPQVVPQAPAPQPQPNAPQQQLPNSQQLPNNQQQQLPNNQQQQQLPNNNQQQQQLPNNQQQQPNNQQQQQLPNNQQQLPNNQQQQQLPNNNNNNQQQQQLPNNQQKLPNNQQQQQGPAQKQESPNDTLCHPKAPPC
jgi:hypothetical protein